MPICGLCKKEKELKNSHLIPKSFYKSLRGKPNTSDIILSNLRTGTVAYTDYQVKKKFLCACCEDRFNKYGETTVIKEAYKNDGQFLLLDNIKNAKYFWKNTKEKWINPLNENKFNQEKYLYFALSVFWRSSAWPDNNFSNQLSLGKKYQEAIRQYLLGKTEAPKKIFLAVSVDNSLEVTSFISFPTVEIKKGYFLHVFYVPGIRFSLILGSTKSNKKLNKILKDEKTNIVFIEYQFNQQPEYFNFKNNTSKIIKPRGRFKK